MSCAPHRPLLPAPSMQSVQASAVSRRPTDVEMTSSSASIELTGTRSDLMVTGASRVIFHDHRRLALIRPVKALSRLGPYAQLHLSVFKARDLIGNELGVAECMQFWKEQRATADPYVEVFLNDVALCSNRENCCHKTTTPAWDWQVPALDIKNPASTVRLQIMDRDKFTSDDLLGFVEFVVADLPPGETLSGWFSLSPRDALRHRAPFRIAAVCSGHSSSRHGVVYAQIRLEIVSGIVSDEWVGLRRRIATNPFSATLDQAGFETVALLDNAEAMFQWIERVVHGMSGKVVDKDRLLEFASLSFDRRRPVFDYETLKQKLRNEEHSKVPFVRFDHHPLKEGNMVEVHGRVGKIAACLDPESPPGTRTYTVSFIYDGFKTEDLHEDQFVSHMDLQWLSNPAVHVLIPKILERRALQMQDLIEALDEHVKRFAEISHGIISWQSFGASSLIFVMLISFGGLWVFAMQHLTTLQIMFASAAFFTGLIAVLMILLCISLNGCCRCCRAYRRATLQSWKYRRKDARRWPFFQEDDSRENISFPTGMAMALNEDESGESSEAPSTLQPRDVSASSTLHDEDVQRNLAD